MKNNPIDINLFTNEKDFHSLVETDIKDFWQSGEFHHFLGVANIRINYAAFVAAKKEEDVGSDRKCIIIVPGRSEGYLKYKELAYELNQQGYDSFIIDHRGQGISQRLLSNTHKGYVASFDDYAVDLYQFIETVVNTKCNYKPYLLAHSMGGLIATRMMQLYPDTIQAAVLSSPMLAINSGAIPKWLGKVLIYGTKALNQWLSNKPWYFLGQGDVKANTYSANNRPSEFEGNSLCQSYIRFEHFSALYHCTPELQLGGVTIHWLAQALEAEKTAFSQIGKLTAPILVLQAGDDSIVDNETQDRFCYQLNQIHTHSCPNGKTVTVKNGRHELFFESDQYRVQALTATLKWFKRF